MPLILFVFIHRVLDKRFLCLLPLVSMAEVFFFRITFLLWELSNVHEVPVWSLQYLKILKWKHSISSHLIYIPLLFFIPLLFLILTSPQISSPLITHLISYPLLFSSRQCHYNYGFIATAAGMNGTAVAKIVPTGSKCLSRCPHDKFCK